MTPTETIPSGTYLGAVSLSIARLDRSLRFYQDVLGLKLRQQEDHRAILTAGGRTPLLELVELPDAQSKPPRTTGLYHYAILVPTRPMLAQALQRLLDARYPLQGGSDHLVSEALYLADPDGNGIEIYADRPRERWQYRGRQLLMATEALDLHSLLAELPPTAHDPEGNTIDPATRIGHVHLHVADLTAAEAFYCGVLGFEVTVRGYPGALFVAAGGYHHHIGLNVWAGKGAPPPPPNALGLRYFTITLPTKSDLQRLVERIQAAGIALSRDADGWFLKDPASNGIRIVPDH